MYQDITRNLDGLYAACEQFRAAEMDSQHGGMIEWAREIANHAELVDVCLGCNSLVQWDRTRDAYLDRALNPHCPDNGERHTVDRDVLRRVARSY